MAKLTVKQLESLTIEDIGRKLFDGDGLYGRVREQKTGIVVTFELRFKLQGKTRTISCGKWPTESLRDIRKKRDAKRLIIATGHDPIEQNKSARLQKTVDQAKTIENQRSELTRLAAEAAARRTSIGCNAGTSRQPHRRGGRARVEKDASGRQAGWLAHLPAERETASRRRP